MVNKLKIKEEKKVTPKTAETPTENIAKNDGENIFNTEGELVVDVFENNSHFVVLAAIAGVHIKDLDIAIEKDMMVIKGHRQDPHNDPEKKFFYQECYWGPFSRKIVLPENIDIDSAEAQMDKGLLTVKIPKKMES
jgi:HSP20 family protein